MAQLHQAQILRVVNEARTNPHIFGLQTYDRLHAALHGDVLTQFSKTIETFQGEAVLVDLRNTLAHTPPITPLCFSQQLSIAAQRIATHKGELGLTDNQDPRMIYDLISQQAHVDGKIGQLIALQTNSGEETAYYFLLDDGLATRKRRRMLLDSDYQHIGIGQYPHRYHGNIVVVLLAESLQNGKEEIKMDSILQTAQN